MIPVLLLAVSLLGCSRQEEAPPEALRWRDSEVVVRVVGAPALRRSDAELAKSLEWAVSVWREACACALPRARFLSDGVRHPMTADGMNVVRIESGHWCADQGESALAPCGPQEILARTEIHQRDVSQTPGIREADMRINGQDPRLRDPGATRALDAVVLHEMGHFLGLSHTDDPRDVMYPVPIEAGRPLRLRPTPREAARLRALYPR